MTAPVIWYCHPTAGSPQEGMSYRPFYLTKYWRAHGYQAFVISSSFHHLLLQPQPQAEAVKLTEIEGVPIIRLKTPVYRKNNLQRIRNMLSYSLGFITKRRKLIQLTGQPQLIIVSSTHPFHYFPLYFYAKKHQIPLVFEVRDLWPSSLIELLKLKPWHPLVFCLGKIEQHAYRHTQGVVSLLDAAESYMQTQGLLAQHFHYIPNGTDCQMVEQQETTIPLPHQNLINQIKHQGGFIVAYLGAMGPPNALIHLFEAMRLLAPNHPEIHCILVGKGELRQNLQSFCQQAKLQQVHFLEPIPKTMVLSLLKQVDLCYLGWQNTNLYQYGVSPNKVFDYMLAAKPILESGGGPRSLIEKAGCGWRCEAGQAEAIAQKLIQISTLSPTVLTEFGLAAKNYVLEHHDYPKLAQDYEQIFHKLIKISL